VSAANTSPQWPEAIEAWTNTLGAPHVFSGDSIPREYVNNTSGLSRAVPVVVSPGCTEDVQETLRIAHRFATPLSPFSAGGNWGLGSKLPVRDGVGLMDLRRMNRVLEVNVEHRYALVEPGVTQQQLYDYLQEHNLPLVINVTGSGALTSVIGNALERGIGYFASRADSLSGMDVVLANGDLLRTGFDASVGSLRYVYRHGVGPGLDGLFYQSNLGVVTRAAIPLMPAAEAHLVVIVKIADDAGFEAFFERLITLRRREIIRTVWHVGNRARSEIALGPMLSDVLKSRQGGDAATRRSEALRIMEEEGFGAWNAVGGVFGTRAQLRVMQREIKKQLKGVADVQFLDDQRLSRAGRILDALSFLPAARRKRIVLEAMKPLYGLSKGIPTNATLKSVLWPLGENVDEEIENPDNSHSGMLYCLPFFPLMPQHARRIIRQAHEILGGAGFDTAITMNLIDDNVGEAVISVAFDRRDPARAEAAQESIARLTETCIDMGYPPYRVGIQSMSLLTRDGEPRRNTFQSLKQVLDPKGIIAPGRYDFL